MMSHLSKSKFLAGLQCEKRLWLELFDPEKAASTTAFQQHLLDQGTAVGKRARQCFPDGVLININREHLSQAVEETQNAIANGVTTLFEAAFSADGVYIIADVLVQNEDASWHLIEVKSSTKVKQEHEYDLATQKHVLEKSGLAVRKTSLMLINTECVFPDLSNLFRFEDITDGVNALCPSVPAQLQALKAVVTNEGEPNVLIGDHCKNPHECPFKAHCWAFVEDRPLVFDIPRLTKEKKENLRQSNIVFVDDLPADFPLTAKQQVYVKRLSEARKEIDRDGIRRQLAQLIHPIYFLDFETFNPAIPRFEGMRPYQQFPFQYSCHVLHENGELSHREYLHVDSGDPRESLIQSLLDCLGGQGSIIVYYAPFERGILMALAQAFPTYADRLHAATDRLWDQFDIFKKHYKGSAFGNSTSLKSILPVLVPTLDYGKLTVQKGDEAQSVWNLMIQTEPAAEKDTMIDNLKAYCALDTLAMVEIHRVLQTCTT